MPHPPRSAAGFAFSLLAFVIVVACTGAGCSSGADDDSMPNDPNGSGTAGGANVTPTNVHVGLAIDGQQIDLLGLVEADSDQRAARPLHREDATLYWLFESAPGKVVAGGAVADPRLVVAEIGGTGLVPPVTSHESSGTLEVTIPNVGGTISFYDVPPNTTIVSPGDPSPPPTSSPSPFATVPIPKTISSFWSSLMPSTSTIDAALDKMGIKHIVDHGDCGGQFNLLIMPDGYQSGEMGKFDATASGLASGLLATGGYSGHAQNIDLWTMRFDSKDSGISDPMNKISKDTAFNGSFGDDKSRPRRCVLPAEHIPLGTRLRMWAGKTITKADAVVILMNSQEWGGCAKPWEKLMAFTVSPAGPLDRVFAHELGHALFDLRDEYNYGTCNPNGSDSPNTSHNLGNLPWKDMVNASLPTAVGEGENPQTVGAFEGADYCEKGAYRPSGHCMMNDLAEFCPVCLRRLNGVLSSRKVKKDCDAGQDAAPESGPVADGGGPVEGGAPTDAGGPSTQTDLYDSCVGRADGVYCSQLADYSSIVCKDGNIMSGQQCASGTCTGPNGAGTTVQCSGGSAPPPSDAGPDSGSTSDCGGKPDGVYCSPLQAYFAIECKDGTIAGGQYCSSTQKCVGPNGPGAIQCQ